MKGNVEGELLKRFEPFLYDLKGHARAEVEELFPLLAKVQKCQTLLEKFMAGSKFQ